MSINWPDNNLDDVSQVWRRKVEEGIDAAARAGSIAATNSKAAQKGARATRLAITAANLDIADQQKAIEQGRRVPAAPSDPAASSDAYFDEYGYAKATVFATVARVTTDVNDVEISVVRYELHGRPNVSGESWNAIAEEIVVDDADPQLKAIGLPAGEDWAVKMRAVSDTGVAGEFSAEVVLTLARDETAPPKPAPPTGTSRMGQVTIEWTGLDETGAVQPADFSHAEVGMATSLAGEGTVVGQIGREDTFVAPELPYNSARWYYVVAVDFAGNRSVESDRVEVITKPAVDTDFIGRVLDGANIKLDSIQADVIEAGAITEEKISEQVNDKITGAVTDSATAIEQAGEAKQEAAAAQFTADGKNRIYVQVDSPGDNLVANGSFEVGAGSVEIARNRVTNPSAEIDASGWGAARATLTRDTGQSRYGDASFKVVVSDTSSSQYLISDAGSASRFPVTGGETVDVIASVRPAVTAPQFALQLYEYDSSGVLLTPVITGDAVDCRAGAWTDIHSPLTVKANAASVRVVVIPLGAFSTIGDTYWVDGIGLGVDKFFDGSQVPKVARNLAQSPTPAAGTTWSPGSSITAMSDGTPCLEVTASGSSTPYIFSATSAEPAFSGETYTMKAKFQVVGDAADATYTFRIHSRSGNVYFASGGQSIVATGGVQEVTVVGTLNADVIANSLDFAMVRDGAAGSAGAKLRMGRVVTVKGEYTGDPFDGSSAPAGFGSAWEGAVNASPSYLYDADLSVAWVGAANASAATLAGSGVSGVSGSPYTGARSFQSSRWASSGSKSLRISAWGTGGSSNAAVVASAIPMLAGETYTITATAHLEAPLTGTNENYARRLRAGSSSRGFAVSPQAPNEAGDHEIRWVLTPEADVTTFQLWHGGMPGSPDIWWDNLVILEGDVEKPFVQGDLWYVTDPANPSRVTGVKIWDGATWNDHQIVADSVIVPGSVGGTLIKDGVVTTIKLDALAVTTAKLAAGAVVADKILGNTITGDKLVINAVTAREIAALSVAAGAIQANAVTADKINAGAVTTVKLDALAVTAAKIAADAIEADKIKAGAVTATKISADAIDGKTITGALIRSSATGARTELTSSGLRVLNSSSQELVKLGYGIATGMEVRNPSTGTMVPLASAAFGLVSVEQSNALAYAPTGVPGGQFTPVTRHTADMCILTFTAVSTSYIVDFSQVWAISSYPGGGVSATPYVGLTVNGTTLLAAGLRFSANPASGLSGIFPNAFQRVRQFRGGARISTTPGTEYTIMMDFQMEVSKNPSGAVALSLNDRYIVATPVFQ